MMRKSALRTLSGLCAVAILLLAYRFLPRRAPQAPPTEVQGTAPAEATPRPDPNTFPARYLGRFGIEGRETAMLAIVEKGLNVNAYPDEEITKDSKAVEELRGWILVKAELRKAIFRRGEVTVDVPLEESTK